MYKDMLERVRAMNSAVIYHHPADIQRYLRRWANWWACTMVPITKASLLQAWRDYTGVFDRVRKRYYYHSLP
jgi:hypothetical protein